MLGSLAFPEMYFVFALIVIVWIAPVVLILTAKKVTGRERTAWILATLFISWISWILFLLLAPIKKEERRDE